MRTDATDQSGPLRRAGNGLATWVPLLLYMATTLMTLGILYGKMNGRLDLIEYRLRQIEQKIEQAR